ncbi:transcriptional repressor NrdR [bacterium]|nr:transcriptional repressor NrdR [candidate division CSSED10-310 bacterium]
MKCPYCGHLEDKVVDSRPAKDNESVRRRRECLACSRRFTTYEQIEELQYMVIKKDGRRERFDRGKLMRGLNKACEKRPVKQVDLERLVDEVEHILHTRPDREIATSEIGEYVMGRIKIIDEIAYVRFASVYRQFKDFQQFYDEIRNLLNTKAR